MGRDQREAFYQERIKRLSAQAGSQFRADAAWAVIHLSWLHDALAKHLNTGLAEHDLSLAAFNTLAILEERPNGVPLNELGTLLIKTPANITGLVDGLAKRGLVRRVPHPEDRRVKFAELSDEGRRIMAEILPGHQNRVRAAFSSLEPEEVLQLTAMMRRLLDSLPGEGTP